jgi:hypothetical protein
LPIEDGLTVHQSPDRRAEFQIESVLQHVSFRTGFERLADPGVLGVHGKHEDQRLRRELQYAAGGLNAIHFRQGAVHHDNARLEQLRLLNGFLAVAGLADHVHVGFVFEHAAETAAHKAMIIDQQN